MFSSAYAFLCTVVFSIPLTKVLVPFISFVTVIAALVRKQFFVGNKEALTANDCLINGLYPDYTNCNRFYMCAVNGPVLFQCPAGLHFNPILEYCDWTESAGCTLTASQTEASLTSGIATKTTVIPTISITSKEVPATSDHQLSDNNGLVTESVTNTEPPINNNTGLSATPYNTASAAIESSTITESGTITAVNVSIDSLIVAPTTGVHILNLTTNEDNSTVRQTVPSIAPTVLESTLSTDKYIGTVENSTISEIETLTSVNTTTDGRNNNAILESTLHKTTTLIIEKPVGSEALNGLPENSTNVYTTVNGELSTTVKITDKVAADRDTSSKPSASTTVAVIEKENATMAAILETSLETIVPTSEKTSTKISSTIAATGIEKILGSTSEPGIVVLANVSTESSSATPSSGISILNLTTNSVTATPPVTPTVAATIFGGLSSVDQQTVIPDNLTTFETEVLVNTTSTTTAIIETNNITVSVSTFNTPSPPTQESNRLSDSVTNLHTITFADELVTTAKVANNSEAAGPSNETLITTMAPLQANTATIKKETLIETTISSTERISSDIPPVSKNNTVTEALYITASTTTESSTNAQTSIDSDTSSGTVEVLGSISQINVSTAAENIPTSAPDTAITLNDSTASLLVTASSVFPVLNLTTNETNFLIPEIPATEILVNTSSVDTSNVENNNITILIPAFNATSSPANEKYIGSEGSTEFSETVTNLNTATLNNELSTTLKEINKSEVVDSSIKAEFVTVSNTAPIIAQESTILLKSESPLETTVSTIERISSTEVLFVAPKNSTASDTLYKASPTTKESVSNSENASTITTPSTIELLGSPLYNSSTAIENFTESKPATTANVSTASSSPIPSDEAPILNVTKNETNSAPGQVVTEAATTTVSQATSSEISSTNKQIVIRNSSTISEVEIFADTTTDTPIVEKKNITVSVSAFTTTSAPNNDKVFGAEESTVPSENVANLNPITVSNELSTVPKITNNFKQADSSNNAVSTTPPIIQQKNTTPIKLETLFETTLSSNEQTSSTETPYLVTKNKTTSNSYISSSTATESVIDVETLISAGTTSATEKPFGSTPYTKPTTAVENLATSESGTTVTVNVFPASSLVTGIEGVPTLNLTANETTSPLGNFSTSEDGKMAAVNVSTVSTLITSNSAVPTLTLTANETGPTPGQTVIDTISIPEQTETSSTSEQTVAETSSTPGQTVIETSSTPRQTETSSTPGRIVVETSSVPGQTVTETCSTPGQTEASSTAVQTVIETNSNPQQTVRETSSTSGQTETSSTPAQTVIETSSNPGQTIIETSSTPGQIVTETSLTPGQTVIETSSTPRQIGTSPTPGQTVIETSSTPRQTVVEYSSTEGQTENSSTQRQTIIETSSTPGQTVEETSSTPGQTVEETSSSSGPTETSSMPGQFVIETSSTSGQTVIKTSSAPGQTVIDASSTPGQVETNPMPGKLVIETIFTSGQTVIENSSTEGQTEPNSTPGQTVVETSSTPGQTETSSTPAQTEIETSSTTVTENNSTQGQTETSSTPAQTVIETSSNPEQTEIDTSSPPGQTEANFTPAQTFVESSSNLGQTVMETSSTPKPTEVSSTPKQIVREPSTTPGQAGIENSSTPELTEPKAGETVLETSPPLEKTKTSSTLGQTIIEGSSASEPTETSFATGLIVETSTTLGQRGTSSTPGQIVRETVPTLGQTETSSTPEQTDIETSSTLGQIETNSTPGRTVTETISTPGQTVNTSTTEQTVIEGSSTSEQTATSSATGQKVMETSSSIGQTETSSVPGQTATETASTFEQTETSSTSGHTVIEIISTPAQTETNFTSKQTVTKATTIFGQTETTSTQEQIIIDSNSTSGQTEASSVSESTVIETTSTPNQTETSSTSGQTVRETSSTFGQTEASSTTGQTIIETISTPGQTEATFMQGQTGIETTSSPGQTERSSTPGQTVKETSSAQGQTETSSTPEQTIIATSSTLGQTETSSTLSPIVIETSSDPRQTGNKSPPGLTVAETSSTSGRIETSSTAERNVSITSTSVTLTNEDPTLNSATVNEPGSTTEQSVPPVTNVSLETTSAELSSTDKQTLTQKNATNDNAIHSNISFTVISTTERSNITTSELGTSPVPISEKSPSTEELLPENSTTFNITFSSEQPTTARVTDNSPEANSANKVSVSTTAPIIEWESTTAVKSEVEVTTPTTVEKLPTVPKDSSITYDETFVTKEVTAGSDKPFTLETETAESNAFPTFTDSTTLVNYYANSATELTLNEIVSSGIGQSQTSLGTVTKVIDVTYTPETVASESSVLYEQTVSNINKMPSSEIPTAVTKGSSLFVSEQLTVSSKSEATYEDSLFTTTSTIEVDVATTTELGITIKDAEFRTQTTNEDISSSKSSVSSVSFTPSQTDGAIIDGSSSTVNQEVTLQKGSNSQSMKELLPSEPTTIDIYATSETGQTTHEEVSSTLNNSALPTTSASMELATNSNDGLRSTSSQTVIKETSTTVDLTVSTVSSKEAFKTTPVNIFPIIYATTDATSKSNVLTTEEVSGVASTVNKVDSFSKPTETATGGGSSETKVNEVGLETTTIFELGISTDNNIFTELPPKVFTNNITSELLHNESSTVSDKNFAVSTTVADIKAEPATVTIVHVEPDTTASPFNNPSSTDTIENSTLKSTLLINIESEVNVNETVVNTFTLPESQADEFTTKRSNEISDGYSASEIKPATNNLISYTEKLASTLEVYSITSMASSTDEVNIFNVVSTISSDTQTTANTQTSSTTQPTLDILISQETTKKSDHVIPIVEVQNKTSSNEEPNVKEEVASHSEIGTTSDKVFTFTEKAATATEDTTASRTDTTDESNTVSITVDESLTDSNVLLSSTFKIETSTSGSLQTDAVINNGFSFIQNENASSEAAVISDTKTATVPTVEPSSLNSFTELVTHDEKYSTKQPATVLSSSIISETLDNEIFSQPEASLSTTDWLSSTKVSVTKEDEIENQEKLTTVSSTIVSFNRPIQIDTTTASETDNSGSALFSSTQEIIHDEILSTVHTELEKSSTEHILVTEAPNKANSTVLPTSTYTQADETGPSSEDFSFAKEITKTEIIPTIDDEAVVTSEITTKSSATETSNIGTSPKILEITTEKVPLETLSVFLFAATVNAANAPNYTTFLGIDTSDEVSADKSKENDEDDNVYKDIFNNDNGKNKNGFENDYAQNNSGEVDDYDNTLNDDNDDDDEDNDNNYDGNNNEDEVVGNKNGDNDYTDDNTEDVANDDNVDNNYEDENNKNHKYYGVHFKEGSNGEISSEKSSNENKNYNHHHKHHDSNDSKEKSSTEDKGYTNKHKNKHGKDSEEDKDVKYKGKHKYDKNSVETSKEANSDYRHNHRGKDSKDSSNEDKHDKGKNNKNDHNHNGNGSKEESSREEQRYKDKNNKGGHKHHGKNDSKEESSKEDGHKRDKDSKRDHEDNINDSKEESSREKKKDKNDKSKHKNHENDSKEQSSKEDKYNKDKEDKKYHNYHENDSNEESSKRDEYNKDKNKHHYSKHSRENYSKENKHNNKHYDRSREKSREVKTDVSSSELSRENIIKYLNKVNKYLDNSLENRYYDKNKKNKGYIVDLETFYKEIRKFRKTLRVF